MADIALTARRAWSPRRHATGWSLAGLAVTLLGLVAGVAALAQVGDAAPGARDEMVSSLCYLVPYGLTGAFLVRRRPDLPFGWLLSGAAAALTVCVLATGASVLALLHGDGGSWPAWAVRLSSLQFMTIAVQGFVNVRFPTGRVESRWGRTLDRLMITGLVVVILGGLLSSSMSVQSSSTSGSLSLANPVTSGTLVGQLADSLLFVAPLVVLIGLVAGLRVVVRARRATGVERQQLRWRAFGVLLSLALFPLAVTEVLPFLVGALDGVLFVATLAIPVVRYRLWEIDAVIRRSAAYALVTVLLAGCYVAVAAVGAALVSERVGVVVAAVGVVLALGPVRASSARLVDRLFYGRRSDPYRALSDVGRRLEAVAAPGETVTAVVTAVAASLRLPYVAIERPGDGALLAESGDLGAGVVDRWPLTYQGATVGYLAAAPRRGESAFDPRDRVVLGDIARQSGAAVHAEALTADLLDSRERLVTAREEERRRVRRELHDGLGPMLTALGLNVDAARTHLELVRAERDGDREMAHARAYLARAKDASSRAIVDLRGIVHGLRPPALDDLGLAGAVRMHVHRLAEGSRTRVEVDAPAFGELPAAVEVAAFRIAVEAVTNVLRHAEATTCCVRIGLTEGPALRVEVVDDGSGRTRWVAGVGTLAMRERVAELGGTLTAGPTSNGGRVDAVLPLWAAFSGAAPA